MIDRYESQFKNADLMETFLSRLRFFLTGLTDCDEIRAHVQYFFDPAATMAKNT